MHKGFVFNFSGACFNWGFDKDSALFLPFVSRIYFRRFLWIFMSAAICFAGLAVMVVWISAWKASFLFFFFFFCVSGKIDNFESEASLKIKDKRGGMESEFLVCCWFRVDLAGR